MLGIRTTTERGRLARMRVDSGKTEGFAGGTPALPGGGQPSSKKAKISNDNNLASTRYFRLENRKQDVRPISKRRRGS